MAGGALARVARLAQPAQDGRLGGRGHQRERKLAWQPLRRAAVAGQQVQYPAGLVPGSGQVRPDASGARGEPGRGRGGPDREDPGQPGESRDRQPQPVPAADPADGQERDGQHERELGEQQMREQHGDAERSGQLTAPGGGRG